MSLPIPQTQLPSPPSTQISRPTREPTNVHKPFIRPRTMVSPSATACGNSLPIPQTTASKSATIHKSVAQPANQTNQCPQAVHPTANHGLPVRHPLQKQSSHPANHSFQVCHSTQISRPTREPLPSARFEFPPPANQEDLLDWSFSTQFYAAKEMNYPSYPLTLLSRLRLRPNPYKRPTAKISSPPIV